MSTSNVIRLPGMEIDRITTWKDLYSWLLKFYLTHGKKRFYHPEVVSFCEKVLIQPLGQTRDIGFRGPLPSMASALTATGDPATMQKFNPKLVEFACGQHSGPPYYLFEDLCRSMLIAGGELGGCFENGNRGKRRAFVSTKKFNRAYGITVKIVDMSD